MSIELTDAAKKLLAQRGFDPVLGARPLRRTIQREIEDQLSEKILFGEIEPGQIVLVDVEGWTIEVDDQGRTKAAPESAKFTFRGEAKPTPVPDTPEVATAGTSDAADS
jgi:ATP-dependent Clp protease ATP-binding subunit ClpC